MNHWTEALLPLMSGILLGLFYFGGLWWTIGRMGRTENPMSFYLVSLAVRLAILLLSFFFFLNVGVFHLIVAFVGFMIARLSLVRWIGLARDPKLANRSHRPFGGPSKTGAD